MIKFCGKRKIEDISSILFDECIANLADVYSCKCIENNQRIVRLFRKITHYGLIAGGSVVYALNKDCISKESVGDIDIFCEDINVIDLIDIIVDFFGEKQCIFNGKYGYKKDNCEKFQIIDITFEFDPMNIHEECLKSECPLTNLKFQIIIEPFHKDFGFDVIKKFDFDAVQCGLYKGKVYRTEICKEAHNTMTIRYAKPMQMDRVKKMINKGFKFYNCMFCSLEIHSKEHCFSVDIKNKKELYKLKYGNGNFYHNMIGESFIDTKTQIPCIKFGKDKITRAKIKPCFKMHNKAKNQIDVIENFVNLQVYKFIVHMELTKIDSENSIFMGKYLHFYDIWKHDQYIQDNQKKEKFIKSLHKKIGQKLYFVIGQTFNNNHLPNDLHNNIIFYIEDILENEYGDKIIDCFTEEDLLLMVQKHYVYLPELTFKNNTNLIDFGTHNSPQVECFMTNLKLIYNCYLKMKVFICDSNENGVAARIGQLLHISIVEQLIESSKISWDLSRMENYTVFGNYQLYCNIVKAAKYNIKFKSMDNFISYCFFNKKRIGWQKWWTCMTKIAMSGIIIEDDDSDKPRIIRKDNDYHYKKFIPILNEQ